MPKLKDRSKTNKSSFVLHIHNFNVCPWRREDCVFIDGASSAGPRTDCRDAFKASNMSTFDSSETMIQSTLGFSKYVSFRVVHRRRSIPRGRHDSVTVEFLQDSIQLFLEFINFIRWQLLEDTIAAFLFSPFL